MWLRRIIAVLAGLVLANLLIFGWEAALQQLSFGRAVDAAAMAEPGAVAALPLAAKLWIVGGWLLGAFAGALVAWRVDHGNWSGWVVGALVAALGIVNVVTIPHPFWMALSAVALPFIGALFAFGASRRWHAARLQLRSRPPLQ